MVQLPVRWTEAHFSVHIQLASPNRLSSEFDPCADNRSQRQDRRAYESRALGSVFMGPMECRCHNENSDCDRLKVEQVGRDAALKTIEASLRLYFIKIYIRKLLSQYPT